MKDNLVGSSAVADLLKCLKVALITLVHCHVAFAFLQGQLLELTVTGLWHALQLWIDISEVVV